MECCRGILEEKCTLEREENNTSVYLPIEHVASHKKEDQKLEKRYWKNGKMEGVEEILGEYRDAKRKKRDQMWLMFIDLRKDFDEIERNSHRGLNFWK